MFWLSSKNREHLSQYRFEQAIESSEASKKLFDAQLYKDSVNRSYYAIFHAIRSVLALSAVDFKRHGDVISYFNREYVRPEIFPRELERRIGELQELSEKSDYLDFFTVPKEEAEEQLETAKSVIESIGHFLVHKYLDKGIDDMESGNILPLEEAFEKITELRNSRRNVKQE